MITRNTKRADGLTVGQAMDADAAFLRSIGVDAKDGQPTLDERYEDFKENVRQAVLGALDELSPSGKGWLDKDLPQLLTSVDKHAEVLFNRLLDEGHL